MHLTRRKVLEIIYFLIKFFLRTKHFSPECEVIREAWGRDRPRPEQRDRLLRVNCEEVSAAGLLVTNHCVDMGHLGLYESWFKLRHVLSVPIHEDDIDDVVTDVSLSLHLLFVVRTEGEEGGDVEHDLVLLLPGVDALQPGHVSPHVQPPPVAPPAWQTDPLAQEGEEVLEPLTPRLVTQQFVIHDLAGSGEYHSELKVHASFLFLQPQNVLLDIWRHDFPRDLFYLVKVAVIGEELEMWWHVMVKVKIINYSYCSLVWCSHPFPLNGIEASLDHF